MTSPITAEQVKKAKPFLGLAAKSARYELVAEVRYYFEQAAVALGYTLTRKEE